jgi:hypothetical protein
VEKAITEQRVVREREREKDMSLGVQASELDRLAWALFLAVVADLVDMEFYQVRRSHLV